MPQSPRRLMPHPDRGLRDHEKGHVRQRSSDTWHRLDEIDEGTERRRYEAAAGVVEERAGETQPPVFHNRHKRFALEMRLQPVFEEIHEPEAGNCGVYSEIGGAAGLDDEAAGGLDRQYLPVPFELPAGNGAARKAAANAIVRQEIAWGFRYSMRGE